MSQPEETRQARLDARNLRGIAHPVRMRMLTLLRTDGPATASGLARRLGLNTGATSYHLRQLAEHGFIVDVPDRGTTRERWWAAAHEDTALPAEELLSDDTGRAAMFLHSVAQVAAANIVRAVDERAELPTAWQGVSDISDYLLRLTPAEADTLAADVHATIRRFRRATPEPDLRAPDEARTVTVQFQLIPHPELPR